MVDLISLLSNVLFRHRAILTDSFMCISYLYAIITPSTSPYSVRSFHTPQVDKCGGCPDDLVCVDTGLRCYPEPCESYSCVPPDTCGGCPADEECVMFTPASGDIGDCVVREGHVEECNTTMYDTDLLLNDPEFACIPTNKSYPPVVSLPIMYIKIYNPLNDNFISYIMSEG